MQWVGAFLAVPSVHISQRKFIFPFQTFIFQEKTGLDAKAFSEIYKSFRVCSVDNMGCLNTQLEQLFTQNQDVLLSYQVKFEN
jgi:hypothetical protein